MVNIVADVLTVKDSDSRPTLEMSINDINSAADQPTDDTQFSKYTADEFDTAERIEFHMDFVDPNGPNIRIVDGREATWDSQSDTVSVELDRADTARQGQYYFEWVLIYDVGVTDLANAAQVNSVPDVGFYGLRVEKPTQRSLVAEDEPDRSVGHIWFGEQSDAPTDDEIGSGNVALYAKDDSLLYMRPHGGTETQIASGTAVTLDLDDNGSNESTALQEIATTNDTNDVVTMPTADKALFDMSLNWPTADTVPAGAIGTSELDLSIAPSWTGEHTFGSGWTLGDEGADPTVSGGATLNGADVKVYSGGAVRNLTNIGSGGGGSPGGSDTQLQYNDGGSFGGISGFTHDDVAGSITAVPDIDTTLSLADQAADPATDGELQRNGTDVKVYSGGAIRNMSDIGSASGGSAVILDLGDDGTNESTDLQEIATSATDPNSIFTHPTADKLLIDPNQNWPAADTVPAGAIGTSELDLSIAPSWTGEHTFGAGWTLGDEAADPTANGEATLNGTDVKVYSGGAVRNLTNIGSGSGGSAVILDLGDDGTNESTDLQEIATSATDPNSIFTHPTADKLLIDPNQNWPAADDVPDSAVDHDLTTNFVSNEHVDHSTVNVNSGTYTTGGGDLTTDRTIDVDEAQLRIDSPNAAFQSVELNDAGGENEYTQITELVPSSKTLTVYRWGVYDTSDGTAPTGLEVRLVEGDGTVNTSANTADNSSTAAGGVASYSPAAQEVVKLRAINTTGSDISSVGGCFGYVVA